MYFTSLMLGIFFLVDYPLKETCPLTITVTFLVHSVPPVALVSALTDVFAGASCVAVM